MTEYIHLQGSEQVQTAANTMRGAAEEMRRAASTMDDAARQMRVQQEAFVSALELVLAEHVERLSAALKPQDHPG